MSDTPWMKIQRNIFSNPKIAYMCSQKDGYKYFYLWLRFISLSMDYNGALFVSKNIPHNQKTLSKLLNFSENFIKKSIEFYQKLDMILLENNVIFIKNYCEYQNTKAMQEIKINKTLRNKRYYETHKIKTPYKTPYENAEPSYSDGTELDIELDIKENIKEKSPSLKNKKEKPLTTPEEDEKIKQVITYLNDKAFKEYTAEKKNTIILLKALFKTYSVAAICNVISNKVYEWAGDEKMGKFLRPETLFGNKFESYYNSLPYELRIKEEQLV